MKNGIIPINKPEGISSAQAVTRVKKILKVKKLGHTGTLDPFATGLLLCTINKGTKISRFFLGGDKRYTARICLGIKTDTYDLTGEIISRVPVEGIESLENSEIEKVVQSFSGVQNQVPPAYSALKHNGQPLYKLAREGNPVQKPPRQIEVFDIKILKIQLPNIDIDVHCSSGTYIRSLAYDIGEKLGCGAHLSRLCRTQSSHFRLENAVDLDTLNNKGREGAQDFIMSLSDCLYYLPKIVVEPALEKKISFGQRLSNEEIGFDNLASDQPVRVVDESDNLLAIIEWDSTREAYNYSCVFCA